MRISAIALLMALMLTLGEAKSQEPADTVAAFKNVTDVLVTRSGDTTRVTANVTGNDGEKIPFEYEVSVVENDTVGEIELADEWGLSLPFYTSEQKGNSGKVKRSIVGFEHVFGGWRFNYHDKGHVKNCYEVGCKELIGMAWSRGSKKNSTFSIGMGFSVQRYLAQDGFAYCKEGDRIALAPIGDGQKVKSSSMNVWALNVPMLYKQRFARNMYFCIGAIANLNFDANAQTEILEGKMKQKVKFKGLQQNLFTADVFASLGFDVIGVYVAWSPMNLFKKAYGPELRAWSIGVDLFYF